MLDIRYVKRLTPDHGDPDILIREKVLQMLVSIHEYDEKGNIVAGGTKWVDVPTVEDE